MQQSRTTTTGYMQRSTTPGRDVSPFQLNIPEKPQSVKNLVSEIKEANTHTKRKARGSFFFSWIFGKFMYFWRHPVIRLIPPVYIMITDFLVHAADPADHAFIEYQFPYAGEVWNLIYPFAGPLPMQPGVVFLKLILSAVAIFVGWSIAWYFRDLIRKGRSGKVMRKGRGAILLYPFWIIFCLIVVSQAWNMVLGNMGVERPLIGVNYEQYRTIYLTTGFGTSWQTCACIIDSIVFIMDWATFYLVLDMILQDTSQYPGFLVFPCLNVREWYTNAWDGKFRIVAAWVLFVTSGALALYYTWFKGPNAMLKRQGQSVWFTWEYDEKDRALIYASQFLFDILIVLQDFEFPTFDNNLRIAIMGTNVVFEGRFANYVMMLGVAAVDIKCMFFTIFSYNPRAVGQYTDSSNNVWAIANKTYLTEHMNAYDHGDFANRTSEGCFEKMNQSFLDIPDVCFKRTLSWNPDIEGQRHFEATPGGSSIWMVDGRNGCCDIRIKAKYKGDAFSPINGTTLWNYLQVASIVIFAIVLWRVLAHAISESQKEMCRRVILCHAIATATLDEDATASLEEEEPTTSSSRASELVVGRVTTQRDHKAFVKVRQDIMKHLHTHLETKHAWSDRHNLLTQQTVYENTIGTPFDNPDPHHGLTLVNPIKLSRPARTGSALLLVCPLGVYGVDAGLRCTIGHLKDELFKKQLLAGIPRDSLRIHQRPYTTLKDDEYVAHLLPQSSLDHVAVIYCHVKVTVGEDLGQETSPVIAVATVLRRVRHALGRFVLALAVAFNPCTEHGLSFQERAGHVMMGVKDAFWLCSTGEGGDDDEHVEPVGVELTPNAAADHASPPLGQTMTLPGEEPLRLPIQAARNAHSLGAVLLNEAPAPHARSSTATAASEAPREAIGPYMTQSATDEAEATRRLSDIVAPPRHYSLTESTFHSGA